MEIYVEYGIICTQIPRKYVDKGKRRWRKTGI